jgi:hypothetical protein
MIRRSDGQGAESPLAVPYFSVAAAPPSQLP